MMNPHSDYHLRIDDDLARGPRHAWRRLMVHC
jgi:hypothetical protein